MMDDSVGSSAYDYAMRTPSPKRKSWSSQSPPIYSDRLIPSRVATDFPCAFNLLEPSENTAPPNSELVGHRGVADGLENNAGEMYEQLLQSELLDTPPSIKGGSDVLATNASECRNLFQYKSTQAEVPDLFDDAEQSKSPVPLRIADRSSLPRTPHRKVQKTPLRIMDAPDLQDDFYLNLLHWSSTDVLAVCLGNTVYTWNACNNRVDKMCDLGSSSVTSVNWSDSGNHLAVGTSVGEVQIWDREQQRRLRTMTGHRGHVCALAWNGAVLSTGGKDGQIVHRDVREPAHMFAKVQAHRSQVCGLQWSPDEQQLASGSDDCRVRIWNLRTTRQPQLECCKHGAAVKALAWSPHQAGVLASGGGVADKCIHIWNTVNDVTVKHVDTGSQVCNLIWSKNVNEIVSTHGYSGFEVVVWKYPSMNRVATLTGHSRRVLYLTVSPDGRRIATGSGDFSVRTWDVFPPAKACAKSPVVSLLPSTIR